MFDAEETAIFEALEKDQLIRSVHTDEEIALVLQAAKEYLGSGNGACPEWHL